MRNALRSSWLSIGTFMGTKVSHPRTGRGSLPGHLSVGSRQPPTGLVDLGYQPARRGRQGLQEGIIMTNVWFITGAARGMGVDLAKTALDAGHRVVGTARNADKVTA